MTHHRDHHDPGEKFDEAAGLPSSRFRPMIIVPAVVAVVLLLWGLLAWVL